MLKKATWLRVAVILTSLSNTCAYAEVPVQQVNIDLGTVEENTLQTSQAVAGLSDSMNAVEAATVNVETAVNSLYEGIVAINTGIDRLFLLNQCVTNIYKDEIWGLNLSNMMAQDRLLMEGNLQVNDFQKSQDTLFSTLLLTTSGTPMPTFLQTGIGDTTEVQTYVQSTMTVTPSQIQSLKDELGDGDSSDPQVKSRKAMLDSMLASTYLSATALSDFFSQYAAVEFTKDSDSAWVKSTTMQLQDMVDKYFTPPSDGAPPSSPAGCLFNESQSSPAIAQDPKLAPMASPGGQPLPALTLNDFDTNMLLNYLLSEDMNRTEDNEGNMIPDPTSPYQMKKHLMDMLTNSALIDEDTGIAGLLRRQVMFNAIQMQELSNLVEIGKKQLAMQSLTMNMTGGMTMEFIRSSIESAKATEEMQGKEEDLDSETYSSDDDSSSSDYSTSTPTNVSID